MLQGGAGAIPERGGAQGAGRGARVAGLIKRTTLSTCTLTVGHVAEASDRRPVEAAPSHRAARTSLAPAPGARASRFLFLSLSKPRCPHTRPARCSVRRHARGSVRSPSTFPPFRRAVHYCTAREAHHAKECSPVSLKPTAERPPCVRGGLRRWTRHVVKAGWVKLTGRGTMGAGVRSSRRCWTPPAP
jgi:hypothetical protein